MESFNDEDEEILVCVCASMVHLSGKWGIKKQRRRAWVKEWLVRREEKSTCNMIMQELRLQDAESFRKYLRMNTDVYEV